MKCLALVLRLGQLGLLRLVVGSIAVCMIAQFTHAQTTTVSPSTPTPLTISPQQLLPRFRGLLQKLGNRLTTPGEENTVMTGSMTWSAGGTVQTSSIIVTTQLGGKVRIDNLTAGTSIGSDGTTLWAKSGSLSAEDTALLEVVLNDNMEHFLLWHASGGGSRLLGARFRFDNGSTPNYTGSYYDVYALADYVLGQSAAAPRWTAYCINADLGFLERVQYRASSNGSPVSIETVLTGWQAFQGESFPTQIQNFSNGAMVFSIQFTAVSVGPAVAIASFQP